MYRQHLVQLLYLHHPQQMVEENPCNHDPLEHLHYLQMEKLHHHINQSDHAHHIQPPEIKDILIIANITLKTS